MLVVSLKRLSPVTDAATSLAVTSIRNGTTSLQAATAPRHTRLFQLMLTLTISKLGPLHLVASAECTCFSTGLCNSRQQGISPALLAAPGGQYAF